MFGVKLLNLIKLEDCRVSRKTIWHLNGLCLLDGAGNIKLMSFPRLRRELSWQKIEFEGSYPTTIGTRGQYYKTFYDRNLRIFAIS